MKNIKKKLLKLVIKLVGIAFSFFAVTFLIYFFNLDMKLTAAMEPILFKVYDLIKRDQHL